MTLRAIMKIEKHFELINFECLYSMCYLKRMKTSNICIKSYSFQSSCEIIQKRKRNL